MSFSRFAFKLVFPLMLLSVGAFVFYEQQRETARMRALERAEMDEEVRIQNMTKPTTVVSHRNGNYIQGTVTNRSDHRISYVEVEIDFFDKRQHRIRTIAIRNTDGIGPHGAWDFSGSIAIGGVRSHKARVVEAR